MKVKKLAVNILHLSFSKATPTRSQSALLGRFTYFTLNSIVSFKRYLRLDTAVCTQTVRH